MAAGAVACSAVAEPVPAPDGLAAHSGPPSAALSFAIEAAWQRAVQAREVQGQRRRAEAEQSIAASPWAAPPALEFGHRDDRGLTDAGRRESEIGLAWPLWLPGQRDARGRFSEADLRLAELAQRAARWRIAGEVREAAWTLIAQEAEVAQAQVSARALQTLADDVERRVKAGDLAPTDKLAARAEALAAVARQTEARQGLNAAQTRWAVLTGLQGIPDATEAVAGTLGDPQSHPEVQLAAQAVERASKRLDFVRASRRDPPELSLRYWHEVPNRAERSENSIGVGIRLPFGTDDRNKPLLAAALSELDVAQFNEQRLRERYAAEAAAARSALQAAEQQLAAERSRFDLLQERATLIDKSFRAGETPLPELLRALAAAAQAEAAVARQQAALGLAGARLNQTLGVLP